MEKPASLGMYRSNSGAHKNFQVNGKLIRANKPMALRLTPSLRSQAGSRLTNMYKGKPELKPVNMQISIFWLMSDDQIELVLEVEDNT